MSIRENSKLKMNVSFEKECISFEWEFKDKIHEILITCPSIKRPNFEKNEELYTRINENIDNVFYELIYGHRNVETEECNKLYSLIHWAYLCGYKNLKSVVVTRL